MERRPSDDRHPMTDPTTWVDAFGDNLYRFALARVGNPAAAEDLVQETFLAALDARRNFRGHASMKTWLIGILKHKIVDYLRKKGRERPTDDMEYLAANVDSYFDAQGQWRIQPQTWPGDPLTVYEQKEFMDHLYQCLAVLPPRPASVFMRREIDGLSTSEICKELHLTPTNVWTTLHRARMALRRCLELKWLKPADRRKGP